MSKRSNKYHIEGIAIVVGPNFRQCAATEKDAKAFLERMNALVHIAEDGQRLAKAMTKTALSMQKQIEQADNSGEEWKDGGK